MILALLLAQTLQTPAMPPNGTYKYVSTMNGAEIGRAAITMSGAPRAPVLSESGTGQMNGQSGSVRDTLTLANDLAPVSYNASASIADSRNMRSSIAFAAATATQTGDVSKTYSLIGSSQHFVLLDVGPFTGFFMLPAQMHAWNAQSVTAIVPNFGQSTLLSASAAAKPPRPASVPAGDAAYSFDSIVNLTVWYDPRTYVVDEVVVPTESLIVRRVSSGAGSA